MEVEEYMEKESVMVDVSREDALLQSKWVVGVNLIAVVVSSPHQSPRCGV